MADEELQRLERAWNAKPGDSDCAAQLIQQRLRLGLPVSGDLQEARAHPPRRFSSSLSLQVQVLRPGGGRTQGIGKTPTTDDAGLAIPPHCVWWAVPAPPGKLDLDLLRQEVIAQRIPGLSFEKKKVDDRGLARLAELDLALLNLNENPRVTDAGLARIASLSSLGWLDLGRTGVTDAGLDHLTKLPHLFSLKLWQDTYQGVRLTAEATRPLSACTNLMRLELSGCQVGREGLERLAALPNLRELSVDSSGLAGDDFQAFTGFPRLEVLNAGFNTTGDRELEWIAGLQHLTSLTLVGTGLTAVGLRHLQRLPALRELNIPAGGTFKDDALEVLAAFPALERLDVGTCTFDLERGVPGFPDAKTFGLYLRLPHRPAAVAAALETMLGCELLPRPKGGR